MKRKIYIFSALVILLAAIFGYAQPKLISREELDKSEVKEFVGEFTKSLEETKDLNLTLSKFASKNIKTNLDKFDFDYENQLKELSSDEQFEHKILVLNLIFFGYRNLFATEFNREVNGEENNNDIEKMFPPEVLEILKRSSLISKLFELSNEEEDIEEEDIDDNGEDNNKKPITSLDVAEATEIMRNALAAFKIGIESRESSTEEASALKSLYENESVYQAFQCKGNDECLGLPEKTRIFWNSVFPLCLHIARENGELKVFYIELNIGD